MALKKTGLGRGLGSLIPNKINIEIKQQKSPKIKVNLKDEKIEPVSSVKIVDIDIEKIEANPYQPRYDFDHSDLEDLINSIKEHGILQPLVISINDRGAYELIAGERRLRSAKIAGLKKVPAIVREADSQKKLELALIENIQRKNLNPIEEAMAYKSLTKEFNMVQEAISQKIGKSLAIIANALRLLTLPQEIQAALAEGKIDKTAGRTIAGLETSDEQLKLFRQLLERGINVRQLESYVRRKKGAGKGKASSVDFDVEDKRDMLQSALGTKVRIDKKKGKGNIIISFYSDEELASIINRVVKE